MRLEKMAGEIVGRTRYIYERKRGVFGELFKVKLRKLLFEEIALEDARKMYN